MTVKMAEKMKINLQAILLDQMFLICSMLRLGINAKGAETRNVCGALWSEGILLARATNVAVCPIHTFLLVLMLFKAIDQ